MADATDPQVIVQFLRDLGNRLHAPARLDVGGSSALILADLLSRAIEDIHVIGEVPAAIRNEHRLLDDFVRRYGLRLTHFQSHYLPEGWHSRTRSLGRFGNLDVFLVDPLDILAGKLFSKREKDLDDLRMLKRAFDKAAIDERVHGSARSLLGDSILRPDAERNWYVLFGEPLP